MSQTLSIPSETKIGDVIYSYIDANISANEAIDSTTGFAAGLLINWLEYKDAEYRAISEFDGTPYKLVLPDELYKAYWHHVHDLYDDMLENLKRVAEGNCNKIKKLYFYEFIKSNLLPTLQAAPDRPETRALTILLTGHVEDGTHWGPWGLRMMILSRTLNLANPSVRSDSSYSLQWAEAHMPAIRPASPFHPVTELMLDLADVKPGERIYDPCFGRGELLSGAVSRLLGQTKQYPPKDWEYFQRNSVFGFETDPQAYAIAVARIILNGIEQPALTLGNALEWPMNDVGFDEKFDCILMAPPFNNSVSDSVQSQYPVPAKNGNAIFLQHIMARLRPGGRAVVLAPESFLVSSGPDSEVREKLLRNFTVEGVISLPEGTLSPYTRIRANILYFKHTGPTKAVRLYDAPHLESSGLDDMDARSPQELSYHFKSGKDERIRDISLKALRKRKWILTTADNGDEDMSTFIETIRGLVGSPDIKSLEDVADLAGGIGYNRKTAVDKKDPAQVQLGLLRVSDINNGEARQPSLWVYPGAIKKLKNAQQVQQGDVLISVSGTIGKVGLASQDLFEELSLGITATRGLVIIKPEAEPSVVLPDYLVALLASPLYQKWLAGHAHGAYIQHLSIKMLRELPIPCPDLPIQERLVQAWKQTRGDAVQILTRLLSGADEDPLSRWLEASPEVNALLKGNRENVLIALDRFARAVQALPEETVDASTDRPGLNQWLHALRTTLAGLVHIHQVPPGPAQYALLDRAGAALGRTRSILLPTPPDAIPSAQFAAQSHIQPVERTVARVSEPNVAYYDTLTHRAVHLTGQLVKMVATAIEQLLENITIEAVPAQEYVVLGKSAAVTLHLHNRSALPLLNCKAITQPDIGRLDTVFFQEGQSQQVSLMVPAQSAAGAFRYTVRWSGERLDGEAVYGEIPLVFDVRSVREDVHERDLGGNPYVVAQVVDRAEMFFGRRKILDSIRSQLSAGHRANVILLEGNRRSGKTSILKQLELDQQLSDDWVIVNCQFQAGDGDEHKVGHPTKEIYRLIARNIGWSMEHAGVRVWFPGLEPPNPDKPFRPQFNKASQRAFKNDHPFETLEQFIQDVLDQIQPKRLLLMFDEFEVIYNGIDSGVTSPQVPENLRYLLQTYSNLSAIITGGRRVRKLREEYQSALYGIGLLIPVQALEPDEARALVQQPVAGRLSYVPEAVDRIVHLCAGQPFLIQYICDHIFEHADRTGERTITVTTVDRIAEAWARTSEHFRTLWGLHIENERQRFLLALCDQLQDDGAPITLSMLTEQLRDHEVPYRSDSLISEDMAVLRELELIELKRADRSTVYRLGVPVISYWLRHNFDFEDLRLKAIREAEQEV